MGPTFNPQPTGFAAQTQRNNINPSESEGAAKEPNKEPVYANEELNSPYVDKRSITVALIKNYSLYRKANDKVLQKRRDFIGSSYNSSSILSSNKQEVETYFPALIGIAPNNDSFIQRVKAYLNNIQVPVDEMGKTFDISFHYNKKSDYLRIAQLEQKIEDTYEKVNRQDFKALREALKAKITAINDLEASKCTLGHPLNLPDYIIYRHCLLYPDIAKDLAFINSDPNVRFYFKDDKKEMEKLKKFRTDVLKAKQNFVRIMAEPELFESVFIQYCSISNLPILSSLAMSDIDKETKLDRFSNEEPVKFNKICENKDNKLIGTIEKLIARGELVRMQHNQNIITSEGTFVGSNIKEAVAWFKNPENTDVANALTARLKNI